MLKKPTKTTKETSGIIWKAVIAAIILGTLVTAYLVLDTTKGAYSSLYLKPDSYQNYIEGSSAKLTYGVQSHESRNTDYHLIVFLGEAQVLTKDFTLGPGQTMEDMISFEIPSNTAFPQKMLLNLTANKQTYSVHYWLKGRK
jgi:hypothetical protein